MKFYSQLRVKSNFVYQQTLITCFKSACQLTRNFDCWGFYLWEANTQIYPSVLYCSGMKKTIVVIFFLVIGRRYELFSPCLQTINIGVRNNMRGWNILASLVMVSSSTADFLNPQQHIIKALDYCPFVWWIHMTGIHLFSIWNTDRWVLI